MALKTCKECGHQYSGRAGKCPKCGAPNLKKFGCGMGCLILSGLLFLLILISGIAGIFSELP